VSSSKLADLWDVIAGEAASESPLWGAALRPEAERERSPIFSLLAEPRYALGIETIYEGYLLHYGTPRLFVPADDDTGLLLGDYLYAHGLVRISQFENTAAVEDLAELISLCALLRGDGSAGDGEVWAATASCLGRPELKQARLALRHDGQGAPLAELSRLAVGTTVVDRALEAHARHVG
jgi:hypothetical protein